jgi:hypothetical protein
VSLTRRKAIELGATGFAALLVRPAAALAGAPSVFEMALDSGAASSASAGWRTSAVHRAPRRFDLIGLRWRGESNLHAQVRARRRNGQWSRWVELPHPHAPLSGTDPAWTGPADFFQLRTRGRASGLRARFVRVGRHRARIARRQQQGSGGAPLIITRTEWGGDQVPPREPASYGEVHVAFVHHTVGTNDYAPEDSAGIVLGIARYHRNSNGWNDIGYNFLVDKYGQIFEGRAGGMELAVIGAQAEGWNRFSTGVACLGTFQEVAQTEAGMDALARLLGWKLSLHGVPAQGQVLLESGGGSTNRYPNGTEVTFERISGHRDGNNTACPGELLYAQLADLRSRASRYAGPLSAVTISPGAATVKSGTALIVSGNLRFGDGSPPGGSPVSVEFQTAGSAWQPLVTVACGNDGRWSSTVDVPQSGYLRAVFPGDASRPPLESPAAQIAVAGTIRMSISPRRFNRGGKTTVKGTVDPVPADLRVEVRVERLVGKRWVLLRTKRVRVVDGAYKTRLKLGKPGRHRVWVVGSGAKRSGLVRVW